MMIRCIEGACPVGNKTILSYAMLGYRVAREVTDYRSGKGVKRKEFSSFALTSVRKSKA